MTGCQFRFMYGSGRHVLDSRESFRWGPPLEKILGVPLPWEGHENHLTPSQRYKK